MGLAVSLLILFQVLVRNVILRDFMRPDLTFIGIPYVLHALYDFGFKRVSFLKQFIHALGICARAV